jgi:predicted DNA-binding protein
MIALSPELHQQLKKLAERERRPLSWEVRYILTRYLEENGLWPPSEPAEG